MHASKYGSSKCTSVIKIIKNAVIIKNVGSNSFEHDLVEANSFAEKPKSDEFKKGSDESKKVAANSFAEKRRIKK